MPTATHSTGLSESDLRAIAIALDELDSYVGVMSQDIAEVEAEAQVETLRWASRKLHALLRRSRSE